MTQAEFESKVPDAQVRTGIAGLLGRRFFDLVSDQIAVALRLEMAEGRLVPGTGGAVREQPAQSRAGLIAATALDMLAAGSAALQKRSGSRRRR